MPSITKPADVPAHLLIPRQREDPIDGPVLCEHVDAMIDLNPGGLTWRRTFAGAFHQIPHARHFIRFLLIDSDRQDDAEQIVAELAANAVQHTASGRPQGTFIVEIIRTTTRITIAVYDCGWGGVPRFGAPHAADSEYGRGLAIVAAIADQVGYEGTDEFGHKVWAKIHTRPSP
ncbi:ATP-binding protein [Nonomuraea sp. K274]|uniref:ATP-binding protein n=1 Tax=Nonomuraea cypriaca TaxID=1187855 RepID=A0A931F318_9ACTN|nr:ATP-binding protein [Nonomuraea cypriaca]MBF8191197.1 ATP-binding protein [Nonomuraea cypriaca]